MTNPYLDEVLALAEHERTCPDAMRGSQTLFDELAGFCPHSFSQFRWQLRARYAFAIPDDHVIDTIVRYSPNGVVEIGAGSGYWASLIAQHAPVAAYDLHTGDYRVDWERQWHPVQPGGPEKAAEYPDRTLLLCWPGMDSMGAQTLEAYRGDTLVYVGERAGGCTGDSRFHELLGDCPCMDDCACQPAQWEPVDGVKIPRWFGVHDALYVYRRVTRPSRTVVSSGDASVV